MKSLNTLNPRILIEDAGETAVVLSWPDLTESDVRHQIHGRFAQIRASRSNLPLTAVPGFDTLTVYFDASAGSSRSVRRHLERLLTEPLPDIGASRIVEIPVCYDSEFALDLGEVGRLSGLPEDLVIHLHSSAEYVVQLIGFAPGFPYLAGLPQQLRCPRRPAPRLLVPAGSVAIGGSHTGIYPNSGPGGWNLIGRTPLSLFDPNADPACLCSPGDRVQFRRITRQEFDQLSTTV